MKIKTEALNKLVTAAVRAAGNNKLIPITQMVGIHLENGVLTISATDSFNYLYISEKVNNDEKINVCVSAELLSKLISKFTTEETTIELKENYLLVVGNGEYKLDLLLDDEGKAYSFPVKNLAEDAAKQDIDLVKFTNLKFYGEKSLAQTMEEPDLIAYFVNDKAGISTDRNIMTLFSENISNIALTLRNKFVELISYMEQKIELYTWTNPVTSELNICAKDSSVCIYSKVNGLVENYPYEAISGLIESAEFSITGKITIKDLANVLDRISLMVTPYDSNVIDLKLSDGKLFISSVKSTGVETIKVNEIQADAVWEGKIDIEMLKNQLSSFTANEVKIYLGNDTCIKLSEDKVTKLICLVESN